MSEEIRKAVAAAVKEALQEEASKPCRDCCRTCELEPNMPRDDHKFVFEMRQTITDGRKTMLSVLWKGFAWVLILGIGALLASKAGKWGIGQ